MALPAAPADRAPPGATKQALDQRSFAGDVLKLVTGTSSTLLLTTITTPILTRFYTPNDFGVAALFTSIVGVVGIVACLRYELAIPLPESGDEAANLLGLALIVSVLVGAVVAVAATLGGGPLATALGSDLLQRYLWLVPVSTVLSGAQLALNYWNSRNRRYSRLAASRIVSAVAIAGVPFLGMATGSRDPRFLVLAQVAGLLVAVVLLVVFLLAADRPFFRHRVSFRGMGEAASRHRKFPLYNTWSALLNSASWQLPSFLLSSFFSPGIVGFYSLGFRVIRIPMSLIGQSIGQVFFQRAAEARQAGTLGTLVESVFGRLVRLSLWPMVLLTIASPQLFTWAFGAQWREAGVYSQILALWSFVWFISSPMSLLFSVLDRQEIGLGINVTIFVTRIAALVVGGLLKDARLAMLLFAGSGVVVYGYLDVRIMLHAGVRASAMGRILGRELLRIIPLAMVVAAFLITGVGGGWLAGIAFVITAGYGLLVLHGEGMLPVLPWRRR